MEGVAANELIPDEGAVTESAVWERVGCDPMELLRTEEGRGRLGAIYGEYGAVAGRHGVPIVMCAPTWRANRERVGAGENQRAVEFIAGFTPWHLALMGPRGDCYTPEAALGREEARRFHEWQAGELREARGVLLATFPAVSEALGILDVLEAPAVVSFVLTEEGRLLDGTPLERAMEEIDEEAGRRPVGYWVNCTHAGRALVGLRAARERGELRRLIGVQANSSRLDPREFAGATEFGGDVPEEFAEGLMALWREFGVRVLGGCCGTRAEHLHALARVLTARHARPMREGESLGSGEDATRR